MLMWPPTANPKVTAGFKWPPETLAAIETPTNRANACANAMATSPAGSKAPSSVSSPKAIAEPKPANTKISVALNSDK